MDKNEPTVAALAIAICNAQLHFSSSFLRYNCRIYLLANIIGAVDQLVKKNRPTFCALAYYIASLVTWDHTWVD